MLPAKLLYNPAAGRDRKARQTLVRQVTSTLRGRGFDVHAEATCERGSASLQSREAVRAGVEAVFACGGDGTVHEVLQGITGSDALLGVIPTGSANALAQELRIPRDPVQAARSFRPECFCPVRTMSVQRVGQPVLYSLCMAGAGADGLLMYRMLAVNRSGLGRWRYYEQAFRVFFSHRFPAFPVQVRSADGTETRHRVIEAMALRIGDLQGIFRGIARGASVHDDSLHVILVHPPARLSLPLWFLMSWIGLSRFHPGLTVSKAVRLTSSRPAPLQVDGEWVGHHAATMSIDGPIQRVLVPEAAKD